MKKNQNYINPNRTFDADFKSLFNKLFSKLQNYAHHIVGNTLVAEDIVQDAFFTLWENKYSEDEEKNKAFLFKVVRNSCLNFVKRKQIEIKYVEFLKSDQNYQELYIDDFLSEKEKSDLFSNLLSELNIILGKLPIKSRKVFEMYLFENLTQKEIAKYIDMGQSSVERHLSKARKFVRSELQKSKYQYSVFLLFLMNLN